MCHGLVPSWAELPDSPKGADRTQCGAVRGCGFPDGAQNDHLHCLRFCALLPSFPSADAHSQALCRASSSAWMPEAGGTGLQPHPQPRHEAGRGGLSELGTLKTLSGASS